MSHARRTDRAVGQPVRVVGRAEREYRPTDLREFQPDEQVCVIECASGERTTACFTGVVMSRLLKAVDVAPETTHLHLEARDGYRVCVPIHDALDGLVAYARDGRPLAANSPYQTRFVAPGVNGDHLVKGLARIEACGLNTDVANDSLENSVPSN
jgi:DMSO/TMAO reductase YedYZ molybdopterin-dependent catalytic subunit